MDERAGISLKRMHYWPARAVASTFPIIALFRKAENLKFIIICIENRSFGNRRTGSSDNQE